MPDQKRTNTWFPSDWRRMILLWFAGLLCLTLSEAHEDEHESALANKGVHVERDIVLLEKPAYEALGPELASVQRRTLTRTVLATGNLVVSPAARAWISTWLPGRVEQITVELGQSVKAGQIVAWIRSSDWERLVANLSVATTEEEAARLEWQRIDGLYRDGLASRREWLEARARWQEKQNTVLVNRLQVMAVAGELANPGSFLPVRTPITGRVVRIFSAVGREVEPQHPIMEILGNQPLWFRAQVPQYYTPLVQIGQTARVRLRAMGQAEPWQAMVFARSGRIDPKTLTETVWLSFTSQPKVNLQAGLQGIAQIEVERRENVLAVPASAVVREGMETYVFVRRNPEECPDCCPEPDQSHSPNHATFQPEAAFERVAFLAGLETPDWVEVKEGLSEGQQVVLTGRHQLAVLLPPQGDGEFRVSNLAWKQSGLRVEPVSFQVVSPTVSLEARVAALPTALQAIHLPLAGKLHRLLLTTPTPVRAGQPIAEFQSLELQQWQLAWLQAELTARAQREIVKGYRELLAAGAPLPEQVVRNAELAAQSAETQATSWKHRLTQWLGLDEAQLEAVLQKRELIPLLTLRAPRDGWLIPAELAMGQFVSPNEPVAELLPMQGWYVRARVPEPMWNLLRPGAKARFRPAVTGRPTWLAQVIRLEDLADENGQRLAWVQLLDAPASVPENLAGMLSVELPENGQARLAVPISAIWWEGNESAVFVYHRDRNIFEYRPVRIGQRNDLRAEIIQGLRAGEEIAVTCIPDLRRHYGRLRLSGQGVYCDHCRD
jgi:cobalt-zinc-cadmium efflux system membrane fusion protein